MALKQPEFTKVMLSITKENIMLAIRLDEAMFLQQVIHVYIYQSTVLSGYCSLSVCIFLQLSHHFTHLAIIYSFGCGSFICPKTSLIKSLICNNRVILPYNNHFIILTCYLLKVIGIFNMDDILFFKRRISFYFKLITYQQN